MIIATLLSLSLARAEVTCTQNCEGIAITEGIGYGISQIAGNPKQPPPSVDTFVLHCMIAGAAPTDRWPCDSVEVSSKDAATKIYRGERIVLLAKERRSNGRITIHRVKCPSDQRVVEFTMGGHASIEFREADCAAVKN